MLAGENVMMAAPDVERQGADRCDGGGTCRAERWLSDSETDMNRQSHWGYWVDRHRRQADRHRQTQADTGKHSRHRQTQADRQTGRQTGVFRPPPRLS